MWIILIPREVNRSSFLKLQVINIFNIYYKYIDDIM
jgi:hypothetical protein